MGRCKVCGSEIDDTDNFCGHCGNKAREACHCWVKKQDNYNCGENSCPGYELHRIEKD